MDAATSRCADTVAIAFHASSYATPHNDHSIPGNHPAYRPPYRLGRQYAPQPVTHSQLTHALVAPFVEGVTPVDVDGSAGVVTAVVDRVDAQRARAAAAAAGDCCRGSRPLLHTAQHYVLNVRHGGRRHYDEQRGVEQSWAPQRRSLGYMHSCTDGGDALGALTRKGRGVYNYECTTQPPHPDAARARVLREQAAQLARAGKARVCGPPDHSAVQLGFYRLASTSTAATTSAAAATAVAVAGTTIGDGDDSSTRRRLCCVHDATDNALQQQQQQHDAATAAVTCGGDDVGGAAACVTSLLPPPRMANVRYLGCQRADDDAVQQLQREACVLRRLHAAQRARARAARTREDVQAVCNLPKW